MSSATPYTYPSSPVSRPSTYRPYLHTPRLTLEVLDEENPLHIEVNLNIMNDPTNIAAMGDFGIKTLQQHDILTKATTLLPQHTPSGKTPSGFCGYIVRLGEQNPTGEIIGVISLASRHADIPPDIGWGFKSAHHGKGYATEAAKEVLRYLMYELEGGFVNVEPKIGIIAWPSPKNRGSVRVAEKIGMEYSGEMTADGGEVEVVYGVPELCGERRYTRETEVSFYGPGEVGRMCKAALLGA